MASWIVHLRIAEKLLGEIEGLDPGQFSIGNVAPDSGKPDKDQKSFDPPPEVTHFVNPNSEGELKDLDDLRFYRDYMAGKVSLTEEREKFSFLLGYFFHLVTDNLWSSRIARPTHNRHHQNFEQDPNFIWEVKKDWYGLDFAYVRSHPECLFWTHFLQAEYQHDYLDFLPRGSISERLDYIKTFYQRTDDEVENSLRLKGNTYLNEAEMALFVDGAYRDQLRIYRMIWEHGENISGMLSASEIIS